MVGAGGILAGEHSAQRCFANGPNKNRTAGSDVDTQFTPESRMLQTDHWRAETITLNGGPNLINSAVTITQDSPTTFTIGGLSALTGSDGNYTLTVSASGISDFFGDVGSGSQSTSWATGTNVPVIVSVGAGNPTLRNTPVDTVDVVLSEPIVPGSFNDQALSLTSGGGPNLITSGVTVTEIDPTTYQIGGLGSLTTTDGDYDLTVSAGGLVDGSGHSGVGLLSEAWT
ncbi:MAG: hypothetical protein ACLPND_12005, partial [Candidatus Korobacteraceae bacterium]